ncbi:ATP-binding protein [Thermomonospora cellulosilytica]|uniref:Anti-sigma regulatory factor (Ser/Thr protein kinase) n=1 Tax=Thermomonospora cellulosilytica TaxID=1411118 RepID=A0A7W3N4W7_9ACTN|nr:ATP-binding protein [Thermomonospora cellulosilytica]MBA9007565.1 anti-sigma regulatory factor (Ser/Thr protein kinase) [Thermomonospora cellulosilytica]
MNGGLVVLGTLTVPGDAAHVRRVRAFAREVLGADHPLLGDIGLCLTEKFGNAVRHTASGRGGMVVVTLLGGDGLVRSEVTDDGAGGERPRRPGHGELAENGRGLLLVAALSRRWGYEADGVRTTVWAEY